MGQPKVSQAICANAVLDPWPISVDPVNNIYVPSSSMRTSTEAESILAIPDPWNARATPKPPLWRSSIFHDFGRLSQLDISFAFWMASFNRPDANTSPGWKDCAVSPTPIKFFKRKSISSTPIACANFVIAHSSGHKASVAPYPRNAPPGIWLVYTTLDS